MRTIFAMIVVLIICTALPTQAVVIWGDNFESENFSNWTSRNGVWRISPHAARSSSYGADIYGSSAPGGDILEVQVNTIGYSNPELSYWSRVREDLEIEDRVRTQWSIDHQVWNTLETFQNVPLSETWTRSTFGLGLGNTQVYVRIIAEIPGGIDSDRMHFDDFVLTGTPIPEPATISLIGLGFLGLVRKRR